MPSIACEIITISSGTKDFMFELTRNEYDALRCQNGTIKSGRGQHSKYLPFAFTEEGIAMLSGMLKSKTAVQVNINIMRAFVAIRHAAASVPPGPTRCLRTTPSSASVWPPPPARCATAWSAL